MTRYIAILTLIFLQLTAFSQENRFEVGIWPSGSYMENYDNICSANVVTPNILYNTHPTSWLNQVIDNDKIC